MGDSLSANTDIRRLALQYYLEYRESLTRVPHWPLRADSSAETPIG
jgi:hypothetical protein